MGIKQNELAEMIEVSNNHLSSMENGKEKPSIETLTRICNALQVTPDYLLLGSMHSDNVPQNIVDSLRLCSPDDVELLQNMAELLVARGEQEFNEKNYT